MTTAIRDIEIWKRDSTEYPVSAEAAIFRSDDVSYVTIEGKRGYVVVSIAELREILAAAEAAR